MTNRLMTLMKPWTTNPTSNLEMPLRMKFRETKPPQRKPQRPRILETMSLTTPLTNNNKLMITLMI